MLSSCRDLTALHNAPGTEFSCTGDDATVKDQEIVTDSFAESYVKSGQDLLIPIPVDCLTLRLSGEFPLACTCTGTAILPTPHSRRELGPFANAEY